jgi:hypothetical protein
VRATRPPELWSLLRQVNLPPGWRLDVDPLDVL